MITVTIVERKSGKITRNLVVYTSSEAARKALTPIAHEMKVAEKNKTDPKKYIDAVSYDTKSEKMLLVEIGAVKLENSIVPDDNSLVY